MVQEQNCSFSQVHICLPGELLQITQVHFCLPGELLQISLMFIHLETFEHFQVSAGMVHITGKKAIDIAHGTCFNCIDELQDHATTLVQACQ